MQLLRLVCVILLCLSRSPLVIAQTTSATFTEISHPNSDVPIYNRSQDNSATNPYFSGGTCYLQSGVEADSSYIPCGNTVFGVFSCCEQSSFCLEKGACWTKGTTYVSGCTDPSYNDPTCPYKGPFADQHWAGLVYCNGTSNEWTLCNDSIANSIAVVSPAPACWCPTQTSLRRVAFAAISTLQVSLLLPSSAGGLMSYESGFSPSSISTNAAASTSITLITTTSVGRSTNSITLDPPGKSNTGSSPISSSQPPASALQSSTPLSTSAKIGACVGASIGGCILLAMLAYIFRCLRRKRRQLIAENAKIRPRSQTLTGEKDPSDEFAQQSPAWSGNKSELQGDERNSASLVSPLSSQGAWTRPTSAEVEGSIPTYQSLGDLRSQAMGGDGGPVYHKPFPKPEAPPVGIHEVAGGQNVASVDHETPTPKRQAGTGVFEMPASIPGSTLQY